jgi:uncharacterized membrane protein
MPLGLKILAGLVAIVGTISFPTLLFANHTFRALYWNLAGQNILYASVLAIVTFSCIIAIASLLWNRQ